MDPKNMNKFRQKIDRFAEEISGWRFSHPYLRIDALLDPARVDGQHLTQLGRLVPFGQAINEPRFCVRKARIEIFAEPREDGSLGTVNAVAFRLDENRGVRSSLFETLASARVADVVYNLARSQDGSPLILVEDVKVD